MKKLRYLFAIVLLLALGLPGSAQERDSRHRVASTIIADGLAQLPAQDNKAFDQVIGEMAGTGSEGMQMLIGMLQPSGQGKNVSFTYAINGIANYVMAPGREALRAGAHDGLLRSLPKLTDKDNVAFLLTVLEQFADKADFGVFKRYLTDDYLRPYALRGLASLPDVDAEVVSLMKEKGAPLADFANLAFWRHMSSVEVEDILLQWARMGDKASDLRAIYNALAACGSSKSLKLLGDAARKAGYKDDDADANDAYLMLLDRLASTNAKEVNKTARQLLKLNDRAMRCAGMKLLLQTSGSNVLSDVVAAMKDKDIQVRNTALLEGTSLVYTDELTAKLLGLFNRLGPGAQVDVLRWMGNNHKAQAAQLVATAMQSGNPDVALAAIHSAGQIGGEALLQALLKALNGPTAAAASEALLAFNGNIGNSLAALIHSTMPNVPLKAIQLAGERHVSAAFADVVKLLKSGSVEQKTAAATALATITTDFNEACELMETAPATYKPQLQKAAKFALRKLSADEQFDLIARRLSSTAQPSLYYPLLAQVGNKQAVDRLLTELGKGADKNAAYSSLLEVDNASLLPILYHIAKGDATKKESAINRYVVLTEKSAYNDIQKYQLYRMVLELNPSVATVNRTLKALSSNHTFPALVLAGSYLDKKDVAPAAAEAVRNILTKNKELLAGQTVKQLLTKAKEVYTELARSDADAEYAIKDINGLLASVAPTGFELRLDEGKAEGKQTVSDKRQYENFELFMEFHTEGSGVLNLRSMPEVKLQSGTASFMYAAPVQNAAKAQSAWTTVYVKLVNDRLFVQSNGQTVADNAVIKNGDGGKELTPQGLISVWAKEKAVEVRNLYVHELPSTPVYTVSKEEKKEDFVALFDGRSLNQWQGNLDNYVPEDGNIYVKAHYGNGGNLYTKKKYSDFIYRFEFCFVKPGVNNGIGIRTKLNTDAAYEGMEIQVLDHDDPIYAGLHPYQQHGAVYGIIVPKHVKFGKLGTWNTEEIQAIGDHIKVTVNGEVILDGNIREACQGHNVAPDGSSNNPYTVDHNNHPGLFNKDGYISFCGHGEGVKFRNIRIKDLSKRR